jgi:hypothetical protein
VSDTFDISNLCKVPYTKLNGQIFYKGSGRVCSVIDIKNQSLPVNDPNQSYDCEGTGLLDDPYEGELFTFWLNFFGGLSSADKQALWEIKRPQLVSVDYDMDNVGPITVQKGQPTSPHLLK